METFGERLRIEREQRGLSITALSEKLGVEAGQLRALERNDFAALPVDENVMNACLQAYADCLEVDAELMIEDYQREREHCLQQLEQAVVSEKSAEAVGSSETTPPPEPFGASTAVEIVEAVRKDEPAEPLPAERHSYDLPRSIPYSWIVGGAVVIAIAGVGAWWMLSPRRSQSLSPSPRQAFEAPASQNTAPTADLGERSGSVDTSPAPDAPARTVEPTRRSSPVAPRRAAAIDAGAAPPTLSTPASVSELAISEFDLGSEMRNRELFGRGDRFTVGQQVWFWTRVQGGSSGDRIVHVWLHDGVEITSVPLKLGGASWRTYSAKMLHAGSAGSWAVEARDESGRVLARSEFVCDP